MPPLCIITHFSCSLCFGCIDIVYWNVRWNGSRTIAPEKNCLLQPKTKPNPNSNPIQGAVFLRDNCLDRNPMWGWEVIFRTPIKYTLLSFTFLLILLCFRAMLRNFMFGEQSSGIFLLCTEYRKPIVKLFRVLKSAGICTWTNFL